MITDTSFGYLKANTVLFAQKMCQSLNDMCGTQFSIAKESLREGSLSTPYSVILFAGFSGAIQGYYIISLDDTVAVNLINAGDAAVSSQWAPDIRSEYSGLLKEALNIAVGQAIEELGKSFRDLAYSPVTAVFGEIEFPHIMSASIVIKGREGGILCSFAINLANLKIGEKLEETLHELERQSNEAKEFDRTIDSVLSLLAAGFVVINGKGIVLPGFSGSVPAIVGLPPTVDIEGEVLPDIIGIPEHMHPEWEQLLTKVFTISGETPFEATAGHHAPIEFTNVRNRRLKLTGCPLAGNGDTPPARLLIVIEDAASP